MNPNTHIVPFRGRKLLIATKHRKEEVIASIFAERLGVIPVVPDLFDTDLFGTFSREIVRREDPLETLRRKCLQVMNEYGGDLAVASEGSFGPHPSLIWLPGDDEWMMLMDRTHHLEVVVRTLSTETNYLTEYVPTSEALQDFAQRAQFPSHALILRAHPERTDEMVKGIQDKDSLLAAWLSIRHLHGNVYAETDMRAMYNPTRMNVIRQTAEKLVNSICSCCPSCHWPGFSVTDVTYGLPCADCGAATSGVLAHHSSCAKCAFSQTTQYPMQKKTEDPQYCPLCNP